MLAFAAQKAVRALLTLWLVVTAVFFVLRLTGDPVYILLPDTTPPDIVAEYRQRWGLDRSVASQYAAYLGGIAGGHLGHSLLDNRDALAVVLERVPKTLLLTGTALLAGAAIGFAAALAAVLLGGLADRIVMAFAVLGYSLPGYFLGIVLILVFSMNLRLLPSAGSGTAAHLVMPAATLALTTVAILARFIRAALLEVRAQPYMRTARAKGLGAAAALIRHALPNAAIPTITVLGFLVGWLIGGAVVIETVFAWPGVGRLLMQSITARDYAVVQAILLLVAATVVLANLLVDLSYALLDPRIRLSNQP